MCLRFGKSELRLWWKKWTSLPVATFGCFFDWFMVVGFVRSGNVYLPGRSGVTLLDAGINGNGWSSRAAAYTSSTSATAYNLGFNASTVNPSNGPNNRWNGFPLRCLMAPAFGADLWIYIIVQWCCGLRPMGTDSGLGMSPASWKFSTKDRETLLCRLKEKSKG